LNAGFPMVTPGRFEVNPEEVKVKFSDVKGVSKLFSYLKYFVDL
jgi:hypothetical protein